MLAKYLVPHTSIGTDYERLLPVGQGQSEKNGYGTYTERVSYPNLLTLAGVGRTLPAILSLTHPSQGLGCL